MRELRQPSVYTDSHRPTSLNDGSINEQDSASNCSTLMSCLKLYENQKDHHVPTLVRTNTACVHHIFKKRPTTLLNKNLVLTTAANSDCWNGVHTNRDDTDTGNMGFKHHHSMTCHMADSTGAETAERQLRSRGHERLNIVMNKTSLCPILTRRKLQQWLYITQQKLQLTLKTAIHPVMTGLFHKYCRHSSRYKHAV